MLMKCLVLCLCLHLYIQVQAQQFKKNEVAIGYGAGYFFDSSAFKFTDFNGLLYSCAMAYTRRLNTRLSAGLSFSRQAFDYADHFTKPEDYKPNALIYRDVWHWGLNGSYSITSGLVPIRIKAGITRSAGYKIIFYGYNWITGEPERGGPGYTKMGVSIGASIGHPIVWRFFGELNGEYFRVNTDLDPSQFYLSYRIGFKF